MTGPRVTPWACLFVLVPLVLSQGRAEALDPPLELDADGAVEDRAVGEPVQRPLHAQDHAVEGHRLAIVSRSLLGSGH